MVVFLYKHVTDERTLSPISRSEMNRSQMKENRLGFVKKILILEEGIPVC